MQKMLQTARLTLRPCAAADVDLLHRHWTDPQVRRYLWDDRIIGKDTTEAFVRSSLASARQHGYGLWILQRRPDGAFCGVCGLRQGSQVWPELLYSVAPEYWGMGIATESADAVLRHAFAVLGLTHIVATVDKPHGASRRVLEKLGFRQTDEQLIQGHPILLYALAADRSGENSDRICSQHSSGAISSPWRKAGKGLHAIGLSW